METSLQVYFQIVSFHEITEVYNAEKISKNQRRLLALDIVEIMV